MTVPAGAVKLRIYLMNYMNSGWAAFGDVSLVPAGGGSNLVANPGFESSGSWSEVRVDGFPGTSFYRSTWGTAAPYQGSYAYVISNHAYGYLYSDSITVSGGGQYNLHSYVRGELDADDSAGSWVVRAVFYDGSNTQVSSVDAASGAAGSLSTTWQLKGGAVTAPAGAVKLRIYLMNYMNSGWAAFDDVSLVPAGGGSNLVANPGFESGGSWSEVRNSAFPGTSFYKATTGAHGGSASYIISNQAYGYAQTGQMAAEGGAEYDLYAKVRGELDPEDSLGSWRLRLTFYDSTGALISDLDTAGGSPEALTSTWTLVGGRVTAPANAATLRVRLLNYQTSGWVAFDEISLTRVAGSQVSYLAYDAENRLKSVSGEVNASYAYDGDGRRVKMVVGGVTTVFAGETFEWTGSTATMKKYYYAGQRRVAMRVGSTLYYLLADHLGSTTVAAASDASLQSRQVYGPWGEVHGETGALPTSFQFTGQRKSELAGVHFFQARYYDSLAGVFLQPDSLVPDPYNPLDWNRYLYVRASPINFNDPSGHAVSCADGDEGGGCGSSSPMVLLNLSTIDTQDAIRKYLRDHPHYHPEFDPAVQNDNSAYFLIATAMMQVSQEGNYSTLMIGMTGMGGNNIVGRSDIFYAIDSQGNRAWMYSSGGGASFPPAPFVSIGASVTITNAPSIDKLVGLGSSTGGIIGVLGVIGITVEIDKFQDSNNNKIYTGFSVSAGSTLSPSPFAGHIYTTATLTKYITWRSK